VSLLLTLISKQIHTHIYDYNNCLIHISTSISSNPTTLPPHHINMSAMTQSRQQVFVSGEFSEPMSAQHNFANNFDLDNPEEAMSAYQKIMHEHTKRQLSTATDSARRRSGGSSASFAREGSLTSEESTEHTE
jgi:hypothetical protein